MRIARLNGRYAHRDIYVVGTGPSMRVFPMEILADKVVLALNQAWRYFAPLPDAGIEHGPGYGQSAGRFALTVHPELVGQAAGKLPRSFRWVVKKKAPLEHLSLDDPDHYVFRTTDQWSAFTEQPADTLFIGRGVQQTAIDLAVRMGARAIYLVGVDMTDLGGEHHGHDQHVRFLGCAPDAVYAEYRTYTARARRIVWVERRVPVLTLSPFVGAAAAAEDYARLKRERGLPDLPPPEDVSPYTRTIEAGPDA